MKTVTVFGCLVAVAGSALAGHLEFKSARLPGRVEVVHTLEQLVEGKAKEESYRAVAPEKIGVALTEGSARLDDDAVRLDFELLNRTKEPLFLRLKVTASIPFGQATHWNGYLNLNTLKFDPDDVSLSNFFPANAVYDRNSALILGLDPLMLCSRVVSDKIAAAGGRGEALLLALPVYLEPGVPFKAGIVVAAAPARYGYHDVIQRWYDLFPSAYRPADRIHPWTISGESSYLFWNPDQAGYRFNGDLIRRLFGGRGTWEWCYKPFVRGGDWSITDQWSVNWRGMSAERVQGVRDRTRARMAPAEFQNVAPMWYLNLCWTEWDLYAQHFPNISRQGPGKAEKKRSWGQDTAYGVYPWGNDYGRLFLDGLARIPQEYPVVRGIAWDSCFAHHRLGLEVDGVAKTYPKSFENGRPFALEAVGVAQLLDFNRQNFAGDYRMANVVNFKLVSPFMIGVRTDAGLYEGQPMQVADRLLRVESMRARLGSPKALVWHKHALPEHMKWVDWDDFDRAEDAVDAYRQIMDNIIYLSYYWGGVPAPVMPALGYEKMVRAVPELIDLIRQGWQPSPAVDLPDGILAARYGQGVGARVALINSGYREEKFTAHFRADYWGGEGLLLSGPANTVVTSKIAKAGTAAELVLPPRSVTVLRVAAAGALPPAELNVRGELVETPGKAPLYRFEIKSAQDFEWQVAFFSEPGDGQVRINCEGDRKRFKAGEKLDYLISSKHFADDVQSVNLKSGQLDLVKPPAVAAFELDVDTLRELDPVAKLKAKKLIILAPPELLAEAERIAEFFRFYTWATDGGYLEPAVNAAVPADGLAISLEIGRDELADYQRARAFADGRLIRVAAADAAAARDGVLAMLLRFDAAYPYYGVLPESKLLRAWGLAGKTLLSAPVKKPFRPTLLEMMRRCKIK